MSYQTLIDLFVTGAHRDGKSRSKTKAGPGRMPGNRKAGAKRLQAAQRGGSYAGTGFITYAEADRICTRVLRNQSHPRPNKYRRGVAESLLADRERSGVYL